MGDYNKSLIKYLRPANIYTPEELPFIEPESIAYIEHQYALYSNQDKWIASLRRLKNPFVKMHCVYEQPLMLRGTLEISDYINVMKNIIVHTQEAKTILLRRGVTANIHVIAHGCLEYSPQEIIPNEPRIFSFGFGLRYKGIEVAVKTVKNLLPEFPNLSYLGVFGEESVPAKHYLKDIKILATGNFTFLDYQPIDELKKLAQTCSLALFPYVGEVYGASGAVRLAMAWGLPVVTSKVSLFDDLKDVVLQGDIENQVRKILKEYPQEQVKIQQNFIEKYSWENMADRHAALFNAIIV